MPVRHARYRGDGNMTCNDMCDRVAVAYANTPSSISSYSSRAVRASCAVIF